MRKLRGNQIGFSIVEALLLIVIVGMIGFVGWYVYNAQKNTDKDLSVTNTTAVAPKKKAGSTNYFTITQWGVRSPYSGALHIEYSIGTDPTQYTGALFSSTELDVGFNGCKFGTTGCAPAGVITRATADQIVAGDGPPGTSAKEFAAMKGNYYGKVGNYYYVYLPPQYQCGSATGLLCRTEAAIKTIVTGLQAVPN